MHVLMSVSAHSMCTNISLSGRWGGLNGSCVILEPSEPARSPCSAYHLATTFRPAQGQPHSQGRLGARGKDEGVIE